MRCGCKARRTCGRAETLRQEGIRCAAISVHSLIRARHAQRRRCARWRTLAGHTKIAAHSHADTNPSTTAKNPLGTQTWHSPENVRSSSTAANTCTRMIIFVRARVVVRCVPGHAQGTFLYTWWQLLLTHHAWGRRKGAVPACRSRSPRTVWVLRVCPMTPVQCLADVREDVRQWTTVQNVSLRILDSGPLSGPCEHCPKCVPPQASRWCRSMSSEPGIVRRLC